MERMRLARFTAAAMVAAIIAVLTAGPAWAHNVLKSTNPVEGEAVARTPSSVVLTFDEPAIALGAAFMATMTMLVIAVRDLIPYAFLSADAPGTADTAALAATMATDAATSPAPRPQITRVTANST